MRNRGKVDAREWWRERAGVIRAARKACAEGKASSDAVPLPGPAVTRWMALRALRVRCDELRRFYVRLDRGELPIVAERRKLRAFATEAAFWGNALRGDRQRKLRDYLVGIGNQAAAFALGLV